MDSKFHRIRTVVEAKPPRTAGRESPFITRESE